MWNSRVGALLMVCGMAGPLVAQTDASFHPPLFTWRDGVMAGAFTLGTLAIRPFDKRVADVMQQPDRQRNRSLRKAAVTVREIVAPGSVIIGVTMYATGRIAKNERLAELGLRGTEALLIGEGAGSVLKDFFGRARPFVDSVRNPNDWQLMRGFSAGGKYQSFPSGHAVAAFAAAAAVTAETSRWWPNSTWAIGPAMYGGATLVGLSRMYDNRHWASDIIMGAAIGTFAGIKVVRYHHEHPGNHLDKWLLNASVSPGDLSHISFSIMPAFR
ncbi:MAG: phosphatase PAP2 family protein [Gemmatimonadaceae bacterium]